MPRRRDHALSLLALLALAACKSPTQIEVTVTTDVPCARVTATSLTSGELGDIEGAPPTTLSSVCTDGRLGAVVLVPSDAKDARVGFKIVTAIDGQAVEECKAPAYGPKCIVSRRALRFEAHTPLEVPVVMREACAGHACIATQTCVKGQCVDAQIDPALCEGAGCSESVLGAGDGGLDATVGDGGADGTIVSTADGGADANADATAPADASGPDGALFDGSVLGCDMRGLEPGAPYPMSGYCPAHRRRSPYVGPKTTPSSVWLVTSTGDINAEPVVSRDGTVYFASFDSKLHALNPGDGGPRWTFDVPFDPVDAGTDAGPQIWGTPAIAKDGTIYFIARDPIDVLFGLDPADGGVRRAIPVPDSRTNLTIGPDGTIYFTSVTSSVEWVTATGVLAPDGIGGRGGIDDSSPSLAADGTIYVSSANGIVAAYMRDGGLRWTATLDGSANESVPIAVDGTLRIGTYGGAQAVYAIAPDGGGMWSVSAPGGSTGLGVTDDGRSFVSSENENVFYASAMGEAGPLGGARSCHDPVLAGDGWAYAACSQVLTGFDPQLGVQWSYPFQGAIRGAPVIGADGTLYFTVTGYDATHAAVYAIR